MFIYVVHVKLLECRKVCFWLNRFDYLFFHFSIFLSIKARNLEIIFCNFDTHLELQLSQVCTLLANSFQKDKTVKLSTAFAVVHK